MHATANEILQHIIEPALAQLKKTARIVNLLPDITHAARATLICQLATCETSLIIYQCKMQQRELQPDERNALSRVAQDTSTICNNILSYHRFITQRVQAAGDNARMQRQGEQS